MITFRPYQIECKNAFFNYYANGGRHGVIVVPTAGGKSLIIGGLVSKICQTWPNQRILVLSHVKELIEQNHEKIMLCWPKAPAGIYSASLGLRQSHYPIVTASIQSVYKKAAALGHRDLVFVDESHLISPSGMGMYNQLLSDLLKINPNLKVCGFTATDFRTDSGPLVGAEGALFNDVIIEIPIKKLLDEGYLTPPLGKSSLIQADMNGVKITAGEFNIKQMAARFDEREFMNAALDADMAFFEGRNSIALFCATIENANHVAEALSERGIYTEVVHGEMNAEDRENAFIRFRSGELRALASVGVMTTGTDIPNIDCLVLFRATESPGLYKQIIGRGFRVIYAPGYGLETAEGRIEAMRSGPKPNFLILDHGGNIVRHGAITHVQKPNHKKKGERRTREKADGRICEICRSWWPMEVPTCGECGTALVAARDVTKNLDIEASNAEIMGTPFSRGEEAKWFSVDDVRYFRHEKLGKPDSLRATYYCGILQFNEWVHFDSSHNFQRIEANRWWGVRSAKEPPLNVINALKWCETLKKPLRILVKKKDNNYYRILEYGFQSLQEKQADIIAN